MVEYKNAPLNSVASSHICLISSIYFLARMLSTAVSASCFLYNKKSTKYLVMPTIPAPTNVIQCNTM